jgi:hypothetical protein
MNHYSFSVIVPFALADTDIVCYNKISNQQSAISNQQSAISNQQSAISNQQSAISNQQSAINCPLIPFLRGFIPFSPVFSYSFETKSFPASSQPRFPANGVRG